MSPGDVDRVIDAAQAVAIPADQKILHILPQEFLIDSQEGIREPVGMSGVRLEAKVHMVTGAESAAQNIVKCVQRCGLEVDDIVLEQLASSYSVLTDAQLGPAVRAVLEAHPDTYAEVLADHFSRHLQALTAGM